MFIGRSVATVAEMAFMAQWALLLGESAGPGQRDVARIVSRILVPIIAVAELCSWYAVLSTNYLGNAFEQSIWTFSAVLVVLGLVWRERGARQRFVGIAVALIGAYVLFMSMVDVPMYLHRWRLDELAQRPYFSFLEGLRDAATRRVVTRDVGALAPGDPLDVALLQHGRLGQPVAHARASVAQDRFCHTRSRERRPEFAFQSAQLTANGASIDWLVNERQR